MASLLLVEDEPQFAAALARGLRDENHLVEQAFSGEDGLVTARLGTWDLIILDWMLPGLSGIEICRRLRATGDRTPILMLTARDAPADVVAGLDAGADDYLVKPFALEVLLARLRTLLRRAADFPSSLCRVGELSIDTAGRQVSVAGEGVQLTTKEYALLEALVRRRGTVLARATLQELLWERESEPESNALQVHVASLRRKLGSSGRMIHTVRGVGYVLRDPS